jgi:hypothetical protein
MKKKKSCPKSNENNKVKDEEVIYPSATPRALCRETRPPQWLLCVLPSAFCICLD